MSRRTCLRLLLLLSRAQLISLDSVALEVRQAAAVSFKNLVKYHWVAREGEGLGAAPPFALPDPEKEQIKAHITDLMLSAPPRVRAQLSEALSIISGHDFPARWQSLLPQLIERLGSDDLQLVNGVLSTADSIYHRYRQAGEAARRRRAMRARVLF